MQRVAEFIKVSRSWLSLTEPVVLVVGNESCDLDSAFSAISLAYFYANGKQRPADIEKLAHRRYVPVLNIDRKELVLKTEVLHLMRKHNIDADDIVCRKEVPKSHLTTCWLILVDHHICDPKLPWGRLIQIFDHRPINYTLFTKPSDCIASLKKVGSCATLITEVIKTNQSLADFPEILPLLRATIVLDTVNFSPSAGKTKPLDVEMNTELEHLLNVDEANRLELFNEIVKARSDISSMTSVQLLLKDLKMIDHVSVDDSKQIIAIPGLPILAETFLERSDSWKSLNLDFLRERQCNLIVLMGMVIGANGDVRRDIAIIEGDLPAMAKHAKKLLETEMVDVLQLERKRTDLNCEIWEQLNTRTSRKQILPMLRSILTVRF